MENLPDSGTPGPPQGPGGPALSVDRQPPSVQRPLLSVKRKGFLRAVRTNSLFFPVQDSP